MAWFTEEKLTSLKITKDELSKSVVALFEKLDDVKDKDSMVEFATSIKNLKNLKPVDKLFIAAFDSQLTSSIDKYIEDLKNFEYNPVTQKAMLPSIYLNTYGKSEIENFDDNKKETPDKSTESENEKKKIDAADDSMTKSGDESQNQNTDGSDTGNTTASA